ncbi:autotransporter outer membrane beta-barrel domain-containing protein, partial [Roseomonas hellenica]
AAIFAGVVSGSGTLRQEGTGTTVLTGANTYTGGTTITAGTLQLGNGGTTGSILGNVANAGTLAFNRSDTVTFAGVVSGTGGVRQDGTGTTVLTGANTYSGRTQVNAGILRAGATNTFSPASAVNVAAGAELDLAGFDQTVAGLTNAGLVSLRGAPGTRLTVAGNYAGQGGILSLNTFLGGDNSASDRLVIQGGTATGDTRVRITNIGGPGAETTEGIRVVQVANGGTTTAGAFRLDTRVAAGAFEYQLFRGGSSSSDDWFLRSFSPPGTPLYRPEVALYAPIAAIGRQMGLATLGTLHERVGEEENIRDLAGGSAYGNGAWARVFGERRRDRWNGTVDASAVGNLVGLQAGFDILRTQPYAGGHRDHVGVYVAYTDYNAPNVSGVALAQQQRVGRLLMSGPAVGAYWTHFGPSGWYVDAVFQANWFDVMAASDTNGRMHTSGVGYTASLEAGYPIRFGQGWQIEPQAQVIWQGVSVDRTRDTFSPVDWDEGTAVTGRLGARLQYTARDARTLWQPYAKVNLWHAFSGTDRVSFGSGAPIDNRYGDTALEVGGGVTARVNQTTSFYAHADYRWSLDSGRARQNVVQASVGIRFNW